MADDLISNVILRSTVDPVKGTENLSGLRKELESIQSVLQQMSSRTYVLKVDIDPNVLALIQQVKQLGPEVARVSAQARSAASSITQAANASAGTVPTGRRSRSRTVTTFDSDGNPVSSNEQFQQGVRRGAITRGSTKTNDAGDVTRIIVDDLNTVSSELDKRSKKRETLQAKLKADTLEEQRYQELLAQYQATKAGGGRPRDFFRSISREDELLFRARREQAKLGGGDSDGPVFSPGNTTASELTRQRREALETRRRAEQSQLLQQLQSQGFTLAGSTTRDSNARGRTEQIDTFQKATRKGIADYEVVQVRANRATGESSRSLLMNAAASRAVGDSFQHAVEKVTLWLSATGLVFATIRGFQQLTTTILQLEAAEVLLARVGRNLGDNFAERREAAKRVRDAVLEIATATGGQADAALKASAIFARAGQNEQQIIQSTKAALLASRVAEVEVAEAADLISAAYLQFNLNASDTIVILDQLNALSNNYRVTTEDLFQALSRSGSVIAQQGGRLTELAAVTAVTSQVTARSGAEIGNATKTIASNLERVDTKKEIFERLGVLTVDAAGKTKSYSRVLFEMAAALDKASESERNQISVTVGGVRQRNILLAQLAHVTEIIKAENRAVFNSEGQSSAAGELVQTSETLIASLQRLQAQALLVANSVGGPFSAAARDAANTLGVLLGLLNSGNGIPARTLAWVGVMAVLVGTLKYFNLGLSVSTVNLVANRVAMAYSALVTQGFGASLTIATNSLYAFSAAQFAALGPAAALALVIAGVARAVSYYSQITENDARLQGDATLAADQRTAAELRKADAYQRSAKYASDLLYMTEKLKKLEKEGSLSPAESKRLQSEYEQRSKEILGSAGVSSGKNAAEMSQDILRKTRLETVKALGNVAIRERDARQQREQIEAGFIIGGSLGPGAFFDASLRTGSPTTALGKEFAKVGTGQFKTMPVSRQYIELLKKARSGDANSMAEVDRVNKELRETDFFGQQTAFGSLKAAGKEYLDILDEQEKLVTRREELTKRLRDIEARQAPVNDRLLENATAGYQGLKSRTEDREFLEKAAKGMREFTNQQSNLSVMNRELDATSVAYKKLNDQVNKLDIGARGPFRERIKKEEERLLELQNSVDKIRLEAERNLASGDLKRFGKLTEAGLLKEIRLAGIAGRRPEEVAGLFDIEGRQAAARTRISDLLSLGSLTGSSTQDVAKQEAIRLEIGEELAKIADLEVQKAEELFNVETKIAAARKQSADEAKRALGTLSDEDRLRVIAQAAYFRKNPNAIISLSDQLFSNQADVGVGQRFFNSNFARDFDPKNPIERMFADSPFGKDFDTERAAKAAADARAGQTDAQLIEQERQRSLEADRARERLRLGDTTGQIKGPNYDLRSSGTGVDGRQIAVDLDVRPQIVDMLPLVNRFSEILNATQRQVIEEAARRFSEIQTNWRADQHLPIAAPSE